MDRGLQLHSGPVAAAQHWHDELEGGLEAACRPPRLLAPVSVDGDGQLLRDDHVLEVCSLPPTKLRPVAQVKVLGQRVGTPATRVFDGLAPPYACGSGEV